MTPDVPFAPAHNDLVVGLPVEPAAAGAARRLLIREGLDPVGGAVDGVHGGRVRLSPAPLCVVQAGG